MGIRQENESKKDYFVSKPSQQTLFFIWILDGASFFLYKNYVS